MIALVLDTHALIWSVSADPRLSRAAQEALASAARLGDTAAISSISLIEVAYLEEKERIPAGTLRGILAILDEEDSRLVEVPLQRYVVASLQSVPRAVVPDMPDRVIVATALMLGVPLVTRDRRIQLSQVRTIW